MPPRKKKFDAEGSGYDYAGARKAGLSADKTGHWPSRVPKSGMILKGRTHKTYSKTQAGETRAGYRIRKVGERYYSHKRMGK